MANGMIDPMMAGNAGLDRMPVSAEPPPMGGGNDEGKLHIGLNQKSE